MAAPAAPLPQCAPGALRLSEAPCKAPKASQGGPIRASDPLALLCSSLGSAAPATPASAGAAGGEGSPGGDAHAGDALRQQLLGCLCVEVALAQYAYGWVRAPLRCWAPSSAAPAEQLFAGSVPAHRPGQACPVAHTAGKHASWAPHAGQEDSLTRPLRCLHAAMWTPGSRCWRGRARCWAWTSALPVNLVPPSLLIIARGVQSEAGEVLEVSLMAGAFCSMIPVWSLPLSCVWFTRSLTQHISLQPRRPSSLRLAHQPLPPPPQLEHTPFSPFPPPPLLTPPRRPGQAHRAPGAGQGAAGGARLTLTGTRPSNRPPRRAPLPHGIPGPACPRGPGSLPLPFLCCPQHQHQLWGSRRRGRARRQQWGGESRRCSPAQGPKERDGGLCGRQRRVCCPQAGGLGRQGECPRQESRWGPCCAKWVPWLCGRQRRVCCPQAGGSLALMLPKLLIPLPSQHTHSNTTRAGLAPSLPNFTSDTHEDHPATFVMAASLPADSSPTTGAGLPAVLRGGAGAAAGLGHAREEGQRTR